MYIETSLRRTELLRDWRTWTQRIAETARKTLPNARVYVVGSVVRGDYVARSDVDILIISDETPMKPTGRSGVKVMIEERLNLPYYHPFEIHLLRPDEAEPYLRRAGKHTIEITQQ